MKLAEICLQNKTKQIKKKTGQNWARRSKKYCNFRSCRKNSHLLVQTYLQHSEIDDLTNIKNN